MELASWPRDLLLLAALVGACAPAAAPRRILYNSYQSDPVPRAFAESLVADWNARNTNRPVEVSIVNHEDFKQAVRGYLTAQPAPDVLDWFAGNRARSAAATLPRRGRPGRWGATCSTASSSPFQPCWVGCSCRP